MIVDSHCHLNHQQLREDVEGVIARAVEAGVERMVVVGFDLPSSEEAVELARTHAPVFAAVAIHPHDSKDYDDAVEARLRELAAEPKVVAIGEIGLDYHYDFSPRDAQYRAFRAQLSLARECGLPVIIHCREAYADVLDVLEEGRQTTDDGRRTTDGRGRWEGQVAGAGGRPNTATKIQNPKSNIQNPPSGVMHCWAGTMEEAERTLALGYYLGFGGVLTFKNADENRRIAAAVALDRILLETDAPYLAPVPYRGKRNEPAFTRLVAQKLAELRTLPEEEIARITTENCRRLFRRLTP